MDVHVTYFINVLYGIYIIFMRVLMFNDARLKTVLESVMVVLSRHPMCLGLNCQKKAGDRVLISVSISSHNPNRTLDDSLPHFYN